MPSEFQFLTYTVNQPLMEAFDLADGLARHQSRLDRRTNPVVHAAWKKPGRAGKPNAVDRLV